MAGTVDERSVMALTPSYRLQWEQAQQAFVLLYPEGMVTLNPSAGEILSRCDGTRSVGDIIEELSKAYPEDNLTADVIEFIEVACDEGWLRPRESSESRP